MDRRYFLRGLAGGVAVGAAARSWPFRVFSFPSVVTLGDKCDYINLTSDLHVGGHDAEMVRILELWRQSDGTLVRRIMLGKEDAKILSGPMLPVDFASQPSCERFTIKTFRCPKFKLPELTTGGWKVFESHGPVVIA